MSFSPQDPPFQVRFSPYAAVYFQELKDKSHDGNGSPKTGSKELTAYHAVRRVMEEIIPKFPLPPQYALTKKHGSNLKGIFRTKAGRLRIFWIASSKAKTAIVLAIGFRKEGDRNDAYSYLVRLLRSGDLDICFEELGMKKPT